MSEFIKIGFEPVFDEDSKVLILGSFPSVVSLKEGFYYGNKQNRFWKTLYEFFGEELKESIELKTDFLKRRKIALWDMAVKSDIKGSMDSNLKNYEIANLHKILEFSKISYIICNGKKSFEILTNNYNLEIKTYCLPSTSPANVSFSKQKWFDALEEIFKDERLR